MEEISADPEVGGAKEQVEEEEEGSEREAPDGEAEDSGILSDKERQNEEVNEKDNCSASSISSASSTLEREDTGETKINITHVLTKPSRLGFHSTLSPCILKHSGSQPFSFQSPPLYSTIFKGPPSTHKTSTFLPKKISEIINN